MALAGCAIGFAFLTKMLQAFLVVPGLALAFLVAAPVGLWKRIGKLARRRRPRWSCRRAGTSRWSSCGPPTPGPTSRVRPTTACCSWRWATTVFERIIGSEGGPVAEPGRWPGGRSATCSSAASRASAGCSGASMGAEASWLLPAALIGLVAGLWFTRRTARTASVRAGLLLWGGWLLVTGAVFSFMDGTIHPYYTVALAPAIAALVGISVVRAVAGREHLAPRIGAGGDVCGHRCVGLRPAGPHAGLVAGAALDRAGRIDRRRGGARRRCAPAGPAHRRRGGRGDAVRLAAPAGVRDRRPSRTRTAAGHDVGSDRCKAVRRPAATGPVDPGPGRPGGPGRGADNAALEELVEGADNRWAAATVGSMTAEQPGTQDRCLDHGDRRLHRRRQFADAAAVPGSTSPTIRCGTSSPGSTAGPPGDAIGHGERHHRLGAAELHAARCRRHHGLRPDADPQVMRRSLIAAAQPPASAVAI